MLTNHIHWKAEGFI